jgi:hypothetical protein
MKKIQLMVIMALLCHSINLFSQRTYNITEQVNDNNEKPVFFPLNL